MKRGINAARVFIILIALTLAALLTFTGIAPELAAAAEGDIRNAYEQTDVLDDLRGSTIAGKAFDIADYPYKDNGDSRLITFVEYCYSANKDKQGDYGLYVYVYNPQQNAYDDSVRNKIQFRYGNTQNYNKYPLTVINYSLKPGYEGLFWKFRVELTAAQRATILNTVNPAARVYEISGIELSRRGEVKDYAVGEKCQRYTYSGTAKGYGSELSVGGDLTCTVDGYTEYAEFDVTHTVYRPKGDSFQGEQLQLNSCFFRVPNKYLNTYGALSAVLCEWYEYLLKPVLVTEEYDVYQKLKSHRGAPLEEMSGRYAFLYQAIGDVSAYMWPKLTTVLVGWGGLLLPGYTDYDVLAWGSNIGMGEKYGWGAWYGDDLGGIIGGVQKYESKFPAETRIENFSAVFYTGGSACPYQDAYITPESLREQLLNNSAALGDATLHSGYSRQLFNDFDGSPDDDNFIGYNREKITPDKEQKLVWNTITKSNFSGTAKQLFFGGDWKVAHNEEIASALVPVSESDLTGDDETVSKRLKIGKGEVSELKAEVKKAGGDETVYLCRYSTDTYFASPCGVCLRDVGDKDTASYDDRKAMARSVLKQNYHLDGNTTSAFIAIETVHLDFDIIELEFTRDDSSTTVIPVVSSPTDAMGGISPPNELPRPGDSISSVPWWVWVIITAVAATVILILICVYVPGAAPVIGKGALSIGKGILIGVKWLARGIGYGIYYLFYGLWRIICTPVEAIKRRRAEKAELTSGSADKTDKRNIKPKKPKARKPHAKTKTKKAGKKK